MKMKEKSVELPLPTDLQIEEFEEYCEVKLPKEYKDFLKKINGGVPITNTFEFDESDYVIENFLCMLDNPDEHEEYGNYELQVIMSQLDERLCEENEDDDEDCSWPVIPIASLFGGDFICLDFRKSETPIIAIWDHEESEEYEPVLIKIADNINQFFDMLFESDGVDLGLSPNIYDDINARNEKIIQYIKEENTEELQKIKATDWDINDYIKSNYPLELALDYRKSLDWLIENGADLNNSNKCILQEAFCKLDIELIEYLISKGADINLIDGRNKTVLSRLKYEIKDDDSIDKILEILKFAQNNGFSIEKSAGVDFREFVDYIIDKGFDNSSKVWEILNYLIDQSVDVNFNKNTMVYRGNETALHLAAIEGNLHMCQFLIDNGADLAKGNWKGQTPYQVAKQSKRTEVAEYIKSKESADLQNNYLTLDKLKEMQLPQALLDIMLSENRTYNFVGEDDSFTITCSDDGEEDSFFDTYDFEEIEFVDINDISITTLKGNKVLVITAPDEMFGMCFYYNLDTKKVSIYDDEHDDFDDLADFDAFLNVLEEC